MRSNIAKKLEKLRRLGVDVVELLTEAEFAKQKGTDPVEAIRTGHLVRLSRSIDIEMARNGLPELNDVSEVRLTPLVR